MPIHRVGGGYKWGSHGHVYPTREGAERQAAAAHANGYEGKAKMDNNVRQLSGATGLGTAGTVLGLQKAVDPAAEFEESRRAAIRPGGDPEGGKFSDDKIDEHMDARGSTEHHRRGHASAGGPGEHAAARRLADGLGKYSTAQLRDLLARPDSGPGARRIIAVELRRRAERQAAAAHANGKRFPVDAPATERPNIHGVEKHNEQEAGDKLDNIGFGGGAKQALNRPGFSQYRRPQASMPKPQAAQKPAMPKPNQPRMQPGGFAARESPGGGGRGPSTWNNSPWNFQRAVRKAVDAVRGIR